MWSNNYIGISYKENGRDRDGLDCWGLARLVYKEQYNINLPSFDSDYTSSDSARVSELLAQYKEGWETLETPAEGAVVLFRVAGLVCHIGVCVSSTHFIHSREGSDVALESFSNHRWSKRIAGYYKYRENSAVVLNAAPHPLRKETITLPVPVGTNLQQVYDMVTEGYGVRGDLKQHVHIFLNGVLTNPLAWNTITVCDGDKLEYRGILRGRQGLRLILTVIVAYIAFKTGLYFANAGSLAGIQTAGQAATFFATQAAVNLVGSYLINAIAPIRPPTTENPNSPTGLDLINGAYNQVTRYATIPVVLGKIRFTPPLGSTTFVEYRGSSDNYLKMLLTWGYGPLYVDTNTLRIGDNPITNYSDVEVVTLDGHVAHTASEIKNFRRIYGKDTDQKYYGLELAYAGHSAPWAGITTSSEDRVFKYYTDGTWDKDNIQLSVTTRNISNPTYSWYKNLNTTGSNTLIGTTSVIQVPKEDFPQTTLSGVIVEDVVVNSYFCVVTGTRTDLQSSFYIETPKVKIHKLRQDSNNFTVVQSQEGNNIQGPSSGYDLAGFDNLNPFLTTRVGVYRGIDIVPLKNYSSRVYWDPGSVSQVGIDVDRDNTGNYWTYSIPKNITNSAGDFPYLNWTARVFYKDGTFSSNPDFGEQGIENTSYVDLNGTINYNIIRTTLVTPLQDDSGWTTSVFSAADPTTIDSNGNYPPRTLAISVYFPEGIRKVDSKDGSTSGLILPLKLEMQIRYQGDSAWTTILSPQLTGPFKDSFIETYRFELTDDQRAFETRIRRTTIDVVEPDPDNRFRLFYRTILQTVTLTTDTNPLVFPTGVQIACSALSIKASNQISGQIDGINAVVNTLCKIYTGTNTEIEDPSFWNTYAPTSNPAALFVYILMHPGNPQKLTSYSELNLKQIQHWYKYCEDPVGMRGVVPAPGLTAEDYKFKYNGVIFENNRSILEVLRDICAAGRASPALIDGKWGVTIDEGNKSVVQHFTPHNSWGFEATRSIPKKLDGLKVKFYDENDNYEEKEIIVYNIGINSTTATMFESIDLPGITTKTLAEDHAKWHFAQIKLRPEIYTFNTDIEYLVCNRGDVVKVAHDVPLWGGGTGRIKEKISNTKYILDENIYIDNTQTNVLRIRSDTGVSTVSAIVKDFSVISYRRISNIVTINLLEHPFNIGDIVNISTNESSINGTNIEIQSITPTSISYVDAGSTIVQPINISGTVSLVSGYYSTVVLVDSLSNSQAKDLDLFLAGILNRESEDLMVISIEPIDGNKNAKLTLVDYGVTENYNIFTDYLTLSEQVIYDPGISNNPIVYIDSLKDKIPNIYPLNISSDESVLEFINSTYINVLKIGFTNTSSNNTYLDLPSSVVSVEGQIALDSDTTDRNIISNIVSKDAGSISFRGVEEGQTYKLRLRYVKSDGAVGLWTNSWSGINKVTHTIIGKTTPPSSVVGLGYVVTEDGINISWESSQDIDYKETLVKIGNQWNTAIEIFRGNGNTYKWQPQSSGIYTVMAKHIDVAGNESYTETIIENLSYNTGILKNIVVDLSNETHILPSLEDGTVYSENLIGSGTSVRVFDSTYQLDYVEQATPTNIGTWTISQPLTYQGLVPGNLVLNTENVNSNTYNYAVLEDLVSIDSNTEYGTVTFKISGISLSGTYFEVSKQQKISKIDSLSFYSINSSTPVVYKSSPDNTTPGEFSRIFVKGTRKVGNDELETYGWLTMTPYIFEQAGTENFIGGPEIDIIPTSADQSTRWIIKMYGLDPSITPPGLANPLLDQEEISVVFEGEVYNVDLESTNGNIFRPGNGSTTILKARVFKNGLEVTESLPSSVFKWRRVSGIPQPSPNTDQEWDALYQSGYKQIEISVDDVSSRATFFCDIII